MSDTLLRGVCAYFDIQPEQVAGLKEEKGTVTVLIDYGIKGVKKFSFSKTLLPAPKPAPKRTASRKSKK